VVCGKVHVVEEWYVAGNVVIDNVITHKQNTIEWNRALEHVNVSKDRT